MAYNPIESTALAPLDGTGVVFCDMLRTENVDMAGEYQNGRDDYPDDEKKKWGHSYFVQRPLKRVRELFGKIVNEIEGTIND